MVGIIDQNILLHIERDATNIGESVNEIKIVRPRYGAPYKSLPMISAEGVSRISELNTAINVALSAGAGANGWTDQLVKTFTGKNQNEENKAFITSVNSYSDLNHIYANDGRIVKVLDPERSGEFVYLSNSTKTPDGGTVILDSQGRKWERVDLSNPKLTWWGAVGDGISDDTLAYQEAIEFYKVHKILVDGEGKSYYSTTRGDWVNCLKRATILTASDTLVFDIHGTMSMYNSAGAPSRYSFIHGAMPLDTGWNKVIAIGAGTLAKRTKVDDVIALGRDILTEVEDTDNISHNLVLGDSALKYLKPNNSISGFSGTRNIALGSLAGHFMTGGYMNVLVGRDCGHNIQNGGGNTAIGYTAHGGGYSPIGWSGSIELQLGVPDSRPTKNVAVGMGSLYYNTGDGNTSLGSDSLNQVKIGAYNTAVGYLAGNQLDSDKSWTNTGIASDLTLGGTYSISGSTVTVVLSAPPPINIIVGDTVGLNMVTGDLAVECGKAIVVSVISDQSFTISNPKNSATTGGNLNLKYIVSQTATGLPISHRNTFIGTATAQNITSGQNNTVVGYQALQGSLSIGTRQDSNVAVGYAALKDISGESSNNTAIGTNAMSSPPSGVTNSTAIGQASNVTASNQVQLGNSQTTTYAYGAVQDRSDIRDKTDIEDMPDLMSDFVLNLRPVQGVWDMRDDYVDELPEEWTDEQKREWWSNPQKDGSKKRNRRHNWFIAQEVKALADTLGIDFAGLQDHKLIDGTDTLTIGYEEFIPPIVSTLQKAWLRIDDIEARLSKLEK